MSDQNGVPRGWRIACVVQRYGVDVGGGSEELCRGVAERLSTRHTVDVLTTCARDYMTWRNELRDGMEIINGVRVRRFKVDAPRNIAEFDSLSARMFAGEEGQTQRDEREWMQAQGPYSSVLLDYISKHSAEYDVFLFFTYLYGTTFYGLPLVADKAVLIPTAHDEPPIYLSIFDRLFSLPRRMLFLTPEERSFVLRRFCLGEDCGCVAGTGLDLGVMEAPVDPRAAELPDGVRAQLDGRPYLLYVGRVDEGKGCHVLIDWFRTYVSEYPDLQLVLAGRQAMTVAPHPQIILAGYLSEEQKHACMDGALAIVAPSPYESLCIAALEAWMRRKAVLANGKCAVLTGQCQRSGGGLWYRNIYEFFECLNALRADGELRRTLGESGHEYVHSTYSWDVVERSYLRAIDEIAAGSTMKLARAADA